MRAFDPSTPTTAMSSEQFSSALPPGIGRDYWHVARNRILWRRLSRTLGPGSCVMDIGCGTGVVVQFLRSKGVTCFGADLGTPVAESPEVEPHLYLGQSAFELDAKLRERVDTLLFMDVLEHLPEPASFLAESGRAFPNVSTVHVTVPARMEIWSNYDTHFGHFRRYTRSTLAEMATDAGFEVVDSAYAFHGLYLAARVTKLLAAKRQTQLHAPKMPAAHALLGRLFELEHRVLPGALKGSSLFAQLKRA